MEDVVLEENSASYGGGLFTDGYTSTINNSVAYSNTASNLGGGIYNFTGFMTIDNTLVSENAATFGGGVSCQGSRTVVDSTLDIYNSTIDSNDGSNQGGGLIQDGCDTSITSSTLTTNYANYGGGIFARPRSITLVDTIVSDNTTSTAGGGAYINGQEFGQVDFDMTGSIFSDNQTGASSNSAGMFIWGDVALTCTGDSSTTAGFISNLGYGIKIYSGGISSAVVTSDLCDWGSSADNNDNSSYDIYNSYTGVGYYYDSDESFVCTGSSCQ